MKIKPLIFEEIKTSHTNFDVDFKLDYNITFIQGDSGVGKSVAYSFIEELSSVDKRIRCLNYLNINRNYKNQIKRTKGKLFVIDNADLLLDDAMRDYIAWDKNNQYIIYGKNPSQLRLAVDEIYKIDVKHENSRIHFSLKQAFN